MSPLTSVFGMGTGMTAPLWPPARKSFRPGIRLGTKGNRDAPGLSGLERTVSPLVKRKNVYKTKPHALLVPLGSTHRCAYTRGLSRSWSTTWLQNIAIGRACLGGGLALRCLQRLSVPYIATRRAAGATTATPLVGHSRSSRTRECSPQLSCGHRG